MPHPPNLLPYMHIYVWPHLQTPCTPFPLQLATPAHGARNNGNGMHGPKAHRIRCDRLRVAGLRAPLCVPNQSLEHLRPCHDAGGPKAYRKGKKALPCLLRMAARGCASARPTSLPFQSLTARMVRARLDGAQRMVNMPATKQ